MMLGKTGGEEGRKNTCQKINALIIRDSRRVFNAGGSKMTQKYRCGDDYTTIFSSLADVRSNQRKHGRRIYVCEFKTGRPATEQDGRPITVR